MPIRLQDLAERQNEAVFLYNGSDVHIKYSVNSITKEFRALSLRMGREGTRIQRRAEEMMKRISTIEAPDGSPEARAEDMEAEKAIAQLQADDKLLKAQLDEMALKIFSEWDVMDGDHMLPITRENISQLPADFISAGLMAVMKATEPGEAKAATSTNDLPSTSKPKDEQDPTPLHQNG